MLKKVEVYNCLFVGGTRGLLMVKEYFEKAAGNEEAVGHYNLGVIYLKRHRGKKGCEACVQILHRGCKCRSSQSIFSTGEDVPFWRGAEKEPSHVNIFGFGIGKPNWGTFRRPSQCSC